ncbi:aminotransferase-like domain-containing protein [Actinomadura parmotrematis]|uniref:PLP-dependent aminotransferase family protein n=1 Tax=Actinomadura parmotrematis TaxID=2864039 RepID=A0ABS7FR04_9ACTN|nr:PLP-dependent aminotransferase family protein [Actinomadura parmotrematis]MBW8482812.1 PLP-dependent aminotransferase family protein [Actinomadura parmotrematis]
METFQRVADAVAADIRSGRLRPGDRLPPQRLFARRRGIAPSTAARVYGELARRGLVTGEVGRGTFVRAGREADAPALAEPAAARVDLELNYPVAPGQSAALAAGLQRLLRPDALAAALGPARAAGTPGARAAVRDLLARPGWTPGEVLFAGNGRQAIAAAVAALVPPGGRLAVEELTYPVVLGVAARLGVTAVPVACDGDGLVPEALAEAHRRTPVHAVYVQPTLQNPHSTTMPPARRAGLAAVLEELGLHAVEDAVWSFLEPDAVPLAAHAPGRTVLVEGFAKRLAPGLSVGVAVPPAALGAPVAAALRAAGSAPSGYALEAVTGWIGDGTADRVAAAKRADAAARQRVVAAALPGARLRTAPRSYFCWWDLPAPWRAETFVAAAARRGIAVTPGAAFAAGPGAAPNAVRIGTASPSPDVLAGALETLAALARSAPDEVLGG